MHGLVLNARMRDDKFVLELAELYTPRNVRYA